MMLLRSRLANVTHPPGKANRRLKQGNRFKPLLRLWLFSVALALSTNQAISTADAVLQSRSAVNCHIVCRARCDPSASDCIPRQCPKVYSCMKANTLGTPLSMKRANQTKRKASYLVRCGTILWGSFASLRLRRSGLPLAVSYHPQLSSTVPATTVLTRTQVLLL